MDNKTFRLFVVLAVAMLTGLAGWGISIIKEENHDRKVQATRIQEDREAATLKNVQARRSDCGNANDVRKGLRIGVEQSQKQLPLILKTLPQLNTAEILAINHREIRRELKAYAPLDCEKYALEALPAKERDKVSLEEQQRLLRATQQQISSLALKAAESRVTTVTQRCELTRLVATGATFRSKTIQAELVKSAANCEKQLAKVKAEVRRLSSLGH